jgi:hypothetical protein
LKKEIIICSALSFISENLQTRIYLELKFNGVLGGVVFLDPAEPYTTVNFIECLLLREIWGANQSRFDQYFFEIVQEAFMQIDICGDATGIPPGGPNLRS